MIDMPSAEMTSDGMLAISEGYFKGGLRTTVTGQILPNVSASFRYAGHGVNGDQALGHSNWENPQPKTALIVPRPVSHNRAVTFIDCAPAILGWPI